jgi:hypothetical protein
MAHLNGLWVVPRADGLQHEWDLIAALELATAHNMKVLGEFQMKKSHLSEHVDLSEARLAYRIFNERFFSTLGAGYDFKNRTPEYRFFLTLSALFGGGR